MRTSIIVCIILLLLGITVFSVIKMTILVNQIEEIQSAAYDSREFTNINCSNMTLERTTDCLVDYVNTFYNYTSKEDYIQSFEDLKKYGGDCFDYSILYRDMMLSLGFHAKSITIFTDNYAHQLTIAWDENIDNYCTIDQTQYDCVMLKD